MNNIRMIADAVIAGNKVTKEQALWLYEQPLEPLAKEADRIRKLFCGTGFDLCAIINGKSGRCTENCRFCAQSAFSRTDAKIYPLLSVERMVQQAVICQQQGLLRYSIVTSGKSLCDREIEQVCEAVKQIRAKTGLSVCVSLGLLKESQFQKLKAAGVSRVHNNLETSRQFFPKVCTTHTFDDKINAVKAAQAAGLSVCSGGIVGMGESVEDRIDLAFTLRDLGIKSVPVNLLNPIPGTPLAHVSGLTAEGLCRVVAVYRFILPDAAIRLAGGRGLLADQGRACFQSGANAAISGDMLTTAGITAETDRRLLEELGYEVRYDDA